MRWTWLDYLATPTDVIEAACELASDQARAQQKASAEAKSRRHGR